MEKDSLTSETLGENRERAVDTLYRAFLSDPIIGFLASFVDPREYLGFQKRFHQFAMRASIFEGISLETPEGQAVSIWLNPQEKPAVSSPPFASFLSQIFAIPQMVPQYYSRYMSGELSLLWELGRSGRKAWNDYGEIVEPIKKKYLGDESHWYCWLVGTLPEHEGKGLCRIMFEEMVKRIDKSGKKAWLDASTEKAMKIYEKFGFKVMEMVRIGKGECDENGKKEGELEGVKLYLMMRIPNETK